MIILKIICLLILFGSGIHFLVRKLSFSQSLAPFVTIAGITSALYIFALFNFLKPGTVIIIIILLGLGILSFLDWPIKTKGGKKTLSPPLVCWLITFLLIVIYTIGTLFYKWDEFSYWGVIYRYLMATNHLPDLASNLIINYYPPFTALIQYFVGTIVENSESNAYLAHLLLSFSSIIAILPIDKWKNWKKYLAILFLCILAVFPLDLRFQSLYVDLSIGLLFGTGLASAVFNNNLATDRIVTICLTAIALTLTKPLGFLLGLICLCILIFNVLYKKYQIQSIKEFCKSLLSLLIQPKIFILISLTILSFVSWNVHTKQFSKSTVNLSFNGNPVSTEEIFPGDPANYLSKLKDQAAIYNRNTYVLDQPTNINISIMSVLRTFTVNNPYSTKLIIKNYLLNISEQTFSTVRISSLNVLLFIMLITLLVFVFTPEAHRKGNFLSQNTIILFIGLIIYCFALLFAYIYYFPPLAGIEAPSINRYLSSYFLGWWLLLLCIIHEQDLLEIPFIKVNASSIITVALIFVFLLVTPISAYLHTPNSPDDSRRFEVSRISKVAKEFFTRNDKVYIIWQVDSYYGLSYYMMKYHLTPIPTNNYGWQLKYLINNEKDQKNIKDDNSIEMNPNEWFTLLNDQGYSHVLVCSSDLLFWGTYGALFDTYQNENVPQLFSVTPTGLINIPIQVKY